jgi:pyruvate dehydrogenase E1 component alpha subunit
MAAWSVDGMDVLEVERAARAAVDGIRNGGGPHFLELRTYRFRAHSMYDPERYREKAEVEVWKERDPIEHLVEVLRAQGFLDDEALAALEQVIGAEIDQAIAFAEAGTLESVDDLTRFVVSEPNL